jgi:hypothetical protein
MRIRLFTAALATLSLAFVVAPSSKAQKKGAEVTLRTPVFRGAASLAPLPKSQAGTSSQASPIVPRPLELDKQATGKPFSGPKASATTHPASPTLKLSQSSFVDGGTLLTYNGLDSVDSLNVNPIFDIEPPDQGLCVGNGFVIETVNLVMAFYDTNGGMLKGPMSMNSFFLESANVFLSDPRCYYDSDTGHFFITILGITPDGRSRLDIGVSGDNNPLHGFFLYQLDTTDDGSGTTPLHIGCPCFPDQPLIGADEYGFYVSTNEFDLFSPFGFQGAQIYAMSKTLLEESVLPTVVQFGSIPEAFGGFSIQPATSPSAGRTAWGTEFFAESRDFTGAGDNTVLVVALTNTSSLDDVNPNLALLTKIVKTPVFYTNPNPAAQRSGPIPQGASLGQPEGALDPDDDRMKQVVFANGFLHTALTTNEPSTGLAAIDVFRLRVTVSGGKIVVPGVRAVEIFSPNLNLLYPAIAVNTAGKGVITFDVSGPTAFPSVAFGHYNGGTFNFNNFHLAAVGAAPEDGFTCYPPFSNGVCRWGDYSAAAPDESGNIWIANEFISGVERDSFANWATTISEVAVH